MNVEELQKMYEEVSKGVDSPELVLFEGCIISKSGHWYDTNGNELTKEQRNVVIDRINSLRNAN